MSTISLVPKHIFLDSLVSLHVREALCSFTLYFVEELCKHLEQVTVKCCQARNVAQFNLHNNNRYSDIYKDFLYFVY